MLPGPIIRRELRAAATRRGQFRERAIVAFLLAAAIALPIIVIVWGELGMDTPGGQLRLTGQCCLIALASIEIIILSFTVPAQVASVIAEEWERDTFPILLISRLRRIELVLAKLIGRMLPALAQASISLPLILAAAWTADLPTEVTLLIVVILLSTVIVTGALSILASARSHQVGAARAKAGLFVASWLFFFPIATVIPLRIPSPWLEFAEWAKALCGLLAPSSPLSLVTNSSWYSAATTTPLPYRLLVMVGMQAAVVVAAVIGAAGSIRARDPYPYTNDPYRGYRPPVGDDPILWRESDLPARRGAGSRIVIWGRYLNALLLMLAVVLVRLLVMAIMFAIPIGLAATTVWLGYHAALEIWQHGYFSRVPFAARTSFNIFARAATGYLGFTLLVGTTASGEARITLERSKGTWNTLLTTPLSGEEIVRSKMLVAAGLLRGLAWLVVPIWVVGGLLGAIHPVGVLLAAIDAPLAFWAGVAVGTRMGLKLPDGVKPGASSQTGFVALGLTSLHGLVLVTALASLEDVRTFVAWPLWVQAMIVLPLLAIPAATGWLAYSVTREMFQKFDEWVDRPQRGTQAPRTHAPELGSAAAVPAT